MLMVVLGIVNLVMLLLLVAMLVLLERKLLSLIQERKGPNIVSVYGLVQTVVDSVKLLTKEMVFLKNERYFFFYASPVLIMWVVLVSWFLMPGLGSSEYGGSVIITFLFISSLGVYSLLWASWGSSSVYSLMGSVRAVAQMISYEVVMALYMLMMMIFSSSLDWESLGSYYSVSTTSVLMWFMWLVVWLCIILAETNRTPFDLVESESELVGGYNVEYSSYSFTLFFLAEYMSIWLMGWVSIVLFTGWNSKLLVFIVVMGFIYVRSLLPRFKFTDLIKLNWRCFLPIVLVSLGLFFMADLMKW